MLKRIYFLAYILRKNDTGYEILVNKESINKLPNYSNLEDCITKNIYTDIDIPINTIVYIYDAELDTTTKQVKVTNYTLLLEHKTTINTSDITSTHSMSENMRCLIVDKAKYPADMTQLCYE